MLNALWPFWVSPIWKDYKNKKTAFPTLDGKAAFLQILNV